MGVPFGAVARARTSIALAAAGTALVLASCTFPVRFATPAEVQQATNPTPITVGGGAVAPPPAPAGLDQIQADLRRLIGQIGPSVVRIDAGTASGSGLLIDAVGTVVTPASLVAGSQQVTVTTSAGQKYTGLVAGADANSDVAVVRVSATQLAQPLLSVVWSWLLIGEPLRPQTIVAAILVLVCVATAQRARTARP